MEQNNSQLNTILRDWAKRNEASPEQLDRLQHAARQRIAAHPNILEPIRDHQARGHWLYALAGAAALAAALLICLSLRTAGLNDRTIRKELSSTPDRDSDFSLSDADLRRMAALASAMQELFAHEWRWIAQSDGDIEIGMLAPNGVVPAKLTHPVLIRFIVKERQRNETEWKTAWETDVLMRSEDFLEFQPNPAHAGKLQLWIYPLGGGKLAVDTGFEMKSPVRAETQVNNLVSEGKPVEIMALIMDTAEYRVLQEVSVLDM